MREELIIVILFLFVSFLCLIGGFAGGLDSGVKLVKISKSQIEYCMNTCQSNGGVEEFSVGGCKCSNDAEFKYEVKQ